MGFEAYVTIVVIIVAFILFATEYFSIDHISMSIVVALVVTGVLSPEDGVKGFANPATITVAAMFVLSDSLLRTGIIDSLTPFFIRLIKKSYYLSIIGITSITGSISAFINNTPVVATFIPIISSAAKKTNTPASKLLIPLSYGAIFGGTCTLIGTSTNLLVSGIAVGYGLEPFNMFLMAPLGLVFLLVGILYLTLFSKKLLPDQKRMTDLSEAVNLKDYLTEIRIVKSFHEDNSPITIENIFKQDGMQVYVDQLYRGKNEVIKKPAVETVLEEGDHLLVRGEMEKIKNLLQNESLHISTKLGLHSFHAEETKLIEIILLPNSELINKKLDDTDFFQKYRSKVLAIRQRGKQRLEDLNYVYLRAGDIVLLQTDEKGAKLLQASERKRRAPFISLSESGIKRIDKKKLFIALSTIVAVVTLASTGVLDIMTAGLAGIAVLLFSKITSPENAYNAVDWKVIVLLAGALSIGEAMQQSGLSKLLAEWLVENVGQTLGPTILISVFYLITSFLTGVMSNNATAALLTPIAISLSVTFGVSPVPFLMSIAFAASADFMTPIGYQTNTMVYSAGNYSFKDFLRIGTPLNIIFWLIASFLIPIIYPL
ncbi:MAG TPA: SLC13 family permease [Flavobacteriaceae bacterium]|nr:SLC13 family permease [Flavobacteriaceae bacterium]